MPIRIVAIATFHNSSLITKSMGVTLKSPKESLYTLFSSLVKGTVHRTYIGEEKNSAFTWPSIHQLCIKLAGMAEFSLEQNDTYYQKANWKVAFDGKRVAKACNDAKKAGNKELFEFNEKVKHVLVNATSLYVYNVDSVKECEILSQHLTNDLADQPIILQGASDLRTNAQKWDLMKENIRNLKPYLHPILAMIYALYSSTPKRRKRNLSLQTYSWSYCKAFAT